MKEVFDRYRVVGVECLAVREKASINSKHICDIKKGQTVQVVRSSAKTVTEKRNTDKKNVTITWLKIKSNEHRFWMSAAYLEKVKVEEKINFLALSAKWMRTVYDKVVELSCEHSSKANTYEKMLTTRATTCGRTASFVFQKAGLLPNTKTFSHTAAVGGDAAHILKLKNNINKAMTGVKNFDTEKCDIVYLGCKNFAAVPEQYKKAGVAFVQDSNVFMYSGVIAGKPTNRSCNNAKGSQVKKDKHGVYRYFNNTVTSGYTMNSPVLVAIMPKEVA